MITHVVFLKLKDPASIQKTRDVLLGMDGKIPQIRDLEVGVDVVRSQRSYDLALITRFDSMEDLQSYQEDPVHLEVLDYIISVRESVVTVDFLS